MNQPPLVTDMTFEELLAFTERLRSEREALAAEGRARSAKAKVETNAPKAPKEKKARKKKEVDPFMQNFMAELLAAEKAAESEES